MDVEMDYQQTADEEEVEILLGNETAAIPATVHPFTLQQPVREDTEAPEVLVGPGTESRIAQPPPSTTHIAPQPPASASASDLEASESKTQGQVGEGKGKERK